MFALKQLLESKGHSTVIFSMNHPKNFDCDYSRYFVDYINYAEEVKNKNISSGIKVLKKTLYSKEAREKIEILLRNEKPDIAHLQNIHHHITPSILYVLKKYNIPIVWTLHDYTIICPNTSFIANGRICERCKKRKYYWPPIIRCKKGSFAASSVAAFETLLHRLMGVYNLVDIFITPSRFLRNKFIEYGFPPERFVHVEHFIDFPVIKEQGTNEDYYLFVGRIAEEKGVKTLIDAALTVNRCHLKIAGGGPLFEEMLEYIKQHDKKGIIECLGHTSRQELHELYMKCKFIIVPSEWYENAGLIIFEAFACGKPVIGANIGGIPEFVKHNERGLVFEAGNAKKLREAIEQLLDNPDAAVAMGENARDFISRKLNPEIHYNKIINLYNNLLN